MKHKAPGINNPGILVRAFEKLGWKVVVNANVRTWAEEDRRKVYPWVAVNPNNGYDIGILQDTKTGELSFNGDTSMMHHDVWSVLGNDFCKVKQQYSVLSLSDWVDSNHGTSSMTVMPNGVIEMELDVELMV